jgi:plasmid stabilization system protein ParE
MKVVLPPDTEEEIEAIYLFIAAQAPAPAISWYNGCLDSIKSLADFPERCPLAPESRIFHRDIRHLLYGNYRIIVTIHAGAVHVLHVRHAARRALRPDPSDG